MCTRLDYNNYAYLRLTGMLFNCREIVLPGRREGGLCVLVWIIIIMLT